MIGRIIRRGANHLICVAENNIMFKSWVKDDGSKQLIWFIEPLEYKGISFLKIEKDEGADMRMWLPKYKKIRKISSTDKDDTFMNSDLTFEDLYRRKTDDYNHTLLKEEKYGDKLCYLIVSSIYYEHRIVYNSNPKILSNKDSELHV